MKCDACGFFDCGNDCRCRCHPHENEEKYDPNKHDKIARKWSTDTQKKEEASMEGLSSLFG